MWAEVPLKFHHIHQPHGSWRNKGTQFLLRALPASEGSTPIDPVIDCTDGRGISSSCSHLTLHLRRSLPLHFRSLLLSGAFQLPSSRVGRAVAEGAGQWGLWDLPGTEEPLPEGVDHSRGKTILHSPFTLPRSPHRLSYTNPTVALPIQNHPLSCLCSG